MNHTTPLTACKASKLCKLSPKQCLTWVVSSRASENKQKILATQKKEFAAVTVLCREQLSPTTYYFPMTLANPVLTEAPEERYSRAPLRNTGVSESDDTVGAVQYKASIKKATQLEPQANVQDSKMERLLLSCRQESNTLTNMDRTKHDSLTCHQSSSTCRTSS